MDPVSLRGKRPREEPADTGASAAHGRSKARRACPDSVADAETWSTSGDEEYAKSEASEESECSGGEEDAKSETSEASESSGNEEDAKSEASEESDSPAAVSVLDWSDTTPAESLTKEVRVPRRTWAWLQTWTLKDVKKMRPCDKKWKKEDQTQLLACVKRVLTSGYPRGSARHGHR